jgi:hypothetical protein
MTSSSPSPNIPPPSSPSPSTDDEANSAKSDTDNSINHLLQWHQLFQYRRAGRPDVNQNTANADPSVLLCDSFAHRKQVFAQFFNNALQQPAGETVPPIPAAPNFRTQANDKDGELAPKETVVSPSSSPPDITSPPPTIPATGQTPKPPSTKVMLQAHAIKSDADNSSNAADIEEQAVAQVCNNDLQQPTSASDPPPPKPDIDKPTPSEPDSGDIAWI